MANHSGYTMKDLYPDFSNVQSTSENLTPAPDQQSVYVKADSTSPMLITKQQKGHTIFAVVGVIALLFAFGLIK